ncbi:SixA phosphatase family protein [Aquimarina sp. 2-A2]|uniref:SixA phosphatase family protein n=1 Tax=Aquimarina sp. 2-A2 TaxID=3382644 RepID=UPI00387EEF9D
MKKIFVLLLISCTLLSCGQEKSDATTTYIFIRHAEKDLSNPANNNPALTPAGLVRAQRWAHIIDSIASNVDLVYSTDYDRTISTAKPVADQFDLKIQKYKASKLYSKSFREKTKGKTVVVVGHSNTTPIFINKIIGKDTYTDIADDDYSKLFIVTMKDDEIIDRTHSFR